MSFNFHACVRKTFADPDIALDLGTANTRLYARGRGIIADEPSVVRMQTDTGRIEEVGISAVFSIKDKQHSIVSPLRAGVVADVKATTALLTPLLRRGRRMGILKPRVLVCTPTDACEEERAALTEAIRSAGAAAVAIAPECPSQQGLAEDKQKRVVSASVTSAGVRRGVKSSPPPSVEQAERALVSSQEPVPECGLRSPY